MIKAIFFDFDGVLTLNSSGHTHTWDGLAEKIDVEKDLVYNCVNPYSSDLYEGRKTLDDIWDDLCRCIGVDIDISVMTEIFNTTPRNEEMFQLVNRLVDNYTLGIITDNTVERVEALAEKFEIKTYFDTLQISAEVGSGKHSEEIFRHALDAVSVLPEEAIFIDNKEVNLLAAKSMGIHTYYFDDSKNDIDALIYFLRQHNIQI
jgi:putative hydrolase of the HAD superfamily